MVWGWLRSGMTASPASGLVRPGTGIGVRNVRERMEVLVWGAGGGGDQQPAGTGD